MGLGEGKMKAVQGKRLWLGEAGSKHGDVGTAVSIDSNDENVFA